MTISLSQQTAQCLVYPSNRKAPKRLARELIEQEVGLTSNKFWTALTKLTSKTQWKPLQQGEDTFILVFGLEEINGAL